MAVKTGVNHGGAIEGIAPPKTYELTLFAMIYVQFGKNSRNTRPFCHSMFCHRRVVKYN